MKQTVQCIHMGEILKILNSGIILKTFTHAYRLLDIRGSRSVDENYFSNFSTKTYAVGAQKNHLNEMFLLSPQTYTVLSIVN